MIVTVSSSLKCDALCRTATACSICIFNLVDKTRNFDIRVLRTVYYGFKVFLPLLCPEFTDVNKRRKAKISMFEILREIHKTYPNFYKTSCCESVGGTSTPD